MAERPLNESFETSGDWYLPQAQERKIAGSLRYTPEGTELHLHEAFVPLRGAIHVGDTLQTYRIVHGTTREGEAVTLLNAHRASMSLSFGSGGMRQPEQLISPLLLIGAHIPLDFTYPKMSFRIPGLQVWLSRPIIKHPHELDETTGNMKLSFLIDGLAKETTRVPAIDADLDWGYGWQSNCDAFTSIAVTVAGWITIRPDTPQPIEWYFEQIDKITAMLVLLAGSPMSPDFIQASIGESQRKVSVLVAPHDAKYCPYINLHEFFMLRGTMDVGLADVVAEWFKVFPSVHMPSQLAISVLVSESLWSHVEFLSLMQALEGFHRGLFEGNYMDEQAYCAIKRALCDAIPSGLTPDHKDALRSRIRYGNQISLRKRLQDLAGLLSAPVRATIFREGGEVPHEWVVTRNYYTHWNEELRANVLEGQAMYNATVRMRHFLRALYLNLMGIPESAILNSLRNASRPSQHLAQLNAIDRRAQGDDTAGVIMTVLEQKADDVGDPRSDDRMNPPNGKL